MKHLKTFENLSTPKMGDYILAHKSEEHYDKGIIKVNKFINNNIGRVVEVRNDDGGIAYGVQYENVPRDVKNLFNHIKHKDGDIQLKNYRYLQLKSIIYFSDQPFDIEEIKNKTKFNI